MSKHPVQPKRYPVFNPLDKVSLANAVANEMLDQQAIGLPFLEQFMGAGVYALYYVGGDMDFKPYGKLAKANVKNLVMPIYVGKAVPEGARKGVSVSDIESSTALYGRLKDHAKSIKAANNLSVNDFLCRFLVVDDIWIPLAESLLIKMYSPLWNVRIDGFGNHDPGSGRNNQKRSAWDVLHPGRTWADKLPNNELQLFEIIESVEDHFSLL